MEQSLLEHESVVLFCVLSLVGALAAAWEAWAPRRAFTAPLRTRWVNNFSVWILDVLLVRWAVPTMGVAFALVVADRGWGLFNMVAAPPWIAVATSILALDLARYGEHWVYHHVPALWRIHRLHHTDTAYDFTLGLRFHPVEGLASAACSSGVVAVLGAPALAVLAYQAVSLASSLLSHANVRMPRGSEALVRRVLVTPDMHRIHHSAAEPETNSNLGNAFPWWDRLFGTYVNAPVGGHERMVIGLERFREARDLWLPWMLINPFVRRS